MALLGKYSGILMVLDELSLVDGNQKEKKKSYCKNNTRNSGRV